MTRSVFGAACLALLLPISAVGQPAPLHVYLQHSGNDAVGTRVVNEVREALRTSARYPLAASIDEARIVLVVVSTDVDPNHPGTTSAIGWTLLAVRGQVPVYVTSGVSYVGSERAQLSAQALVAGIDQAVFQYPTSFVGTPLWRAHEEAMDAQIAAAAASVPETVAGVRTRKAFLVCAAAAKALTETLPTNVPIPDMAVLAGLFKSEAPTPATK